MLGDAGPDRYAKALEVAARDPNSDGLLVILTPQAMTDPTQTAEALKPLRPAGRQAGPGQLDGRGRRRGRRGDPQTGRHPDLPLPRHRRPRLQRTCGATADNLAGLYETPTGRLAPDEDEPDRDRAGRIIAGRPGRRPDAADRGRVEAAARRLRHPDRPDPRRPRRRGRPSASAGAIGYPVVLKLHSETITHKTDVGGVQLNLRDADAVRDAYRAIEASVRRDAPAPGTSWA